MLNFSLPRLTPEVFPPYDNINETLVKSAGGVLYLDARKATGFGIPNNDPLTPLWVDLSGNSNNATPTNMAGTSVSGVDVSEPIRPSWAFDGTNDFMSVAASSSLDVTSTPLAVFATIKMAASAGNGYILNKNLDSFSNQQYAIQFVGSPSNRIQCNLENSARASSADNSIQTGIWYNVGFVWINGTVKIYVNGVQSGSTGSYNGTLTSRPNITIGKRIETSFFKGSMATLTVYADSKFSVTNILKAEKAISKIYTGV